MEQTTMVHKFKKYLEIIVIDLRTACYLHLEKLFSCINLQYCHISLIVFDLLQNKC